MGCVGATLPVVGIYLHRQVMDVLTNARVEASSCTSKAGFAIRYHTNSTRSLSSMPQRPLTCNSLRLTVSRESSR